MPFKRDLKSLAYHAAIVGSLDILKDFTEKSDNKDLHQLKDWVMEIAFYVNALQMEEKGFDLALDEQHKVIRDRDLKIRELEEQIRELKLNQQFEEHIDKNTI